MAEFSSYLDDTAPFNDDDVSHKVYTSVIGDWLRLASQLERVEINTWKYAGDDGLWCGTAADRYSSDSMHFTEYSTALTRYIFVCNALEETYRFVAHHYDCIARNEGITRKNALTKPSMKTAFLVDRFEQSDLPDDFQHISGNLVVFFKDYEKQYSPKLTGMNRVSDSDLSYALHLTRNLRNHIAHGVFPLVDNFDYSSNPPLILFQSLLFHACRVATLYMQALLGKYCGRFQSHEYRSIQDAHGEEFDRFIEHCTIDYSRKLHINGPFSLSRWFAG